MNLPNNDLQTSPMTKGGKEMRMEVIIKYMVTCRTKTKWQLQRREKATYLGNEDIILLKKEGEK